MAMLMGLQMATRWEMPTVFLLTETPMGFHLGMQREFPRSENHLGYQTVTLTVCPLTDCQMAMLMAFPRKDYQKASHLAIQMENLIQEA